MLDTLRALLGMQDTSKDTVLEFYINKAENAINKYSNIDDITPYSNQCVELAMFYYENRKELGKTQAAQGSRSQALIDGIPQSIKETLPCYVKVVG